MQVRFPGGLSAAVALVLCLGMAAPVSADPPRSPKVSQASEQAHKLRHPRGRATYQMMIARHAAVHGVPVELATAVVWQESRYRAKAKGSSGERGLMQILPATARGLGYKGNAEGLYDPEVNLQYGMLYLARAYELGGGDICQTVLRYNGGLGAKTMTQNATKYCVSIKRKMNIPLNMP